MFRVTGTPIGSWRVRSSCTGRSIDYEAQASHEDVGACLDAEPLRHLGWSRDWCDFEDVLAGRVALLVHLRGEAWPSLLSTPTSMSSGTGRAAGRGGERGAVV
jgi:hypothetical protein